MSDQTKGRERKSAIGSTAIVTGSWIGGTMMLGILYDRMLPMRASMQTMALR